jgi:hypothetical protein
MLNFNILTKGCVEGGLYMLLIVNEILVTVSELLVGKALFKLIIFEFATIVVAAFKP